jgi:hypothetical protein
MTAIKETINESSSNFVHIVWPKIKQQIGGGYLIPIESVTDSKFADYLDTQPALMLGRCLATRMVSAALRRGCR